MAMLDFLKDQLASSGWLSLSSLYFDNGFTINVFNSRGYIAMSDSKECFFCYNALDSTDTDQVENKYVMMRRDHIGMQQTITVVGYEHLQHFDLAQYSHYGFYFDEQTETPYPTIPTKAQLDAITLDPDTGLADPATTDTVETISGREVSVIPMYNDFFDPYTQDWQYSAARIKEWKQFYTNQEKFTTLLANAYNVTDAI